MYVPLIIFFKYWFRCSDDVNIRKVVHLIALYQHGSCRQPRIAVSGIYSGGCHRNGWLSWNALLWVQLSRLRTLGERGQDLWRIETRSRKYKCSTKWEQLRSLDVVTRALDRRARDLVGGRHSCFPGDELTCCACRTAMFNTALFRLLRKQRDCSNRLAVDISKTNILFEFSE